MASGFVLRLAGGRQHLGHHGGLAAGEDRDGLARLDAARGHAAPEHGSPEGQRQLSTTIAWMDDEPLVAGRIYWALHGHRWVKARVQRVLHRLNVNTLAEEEATELPPNAIGHVTLVLQEPLATLPFAQSRILGALVLVDTASHKTSGAVLVN